MYFTRKSCRRQVRRFLRNKESLQRRILGNPALIIGTIGFACLS